MSDTGHIATDYKDPLDEHNELIEIINQKTVNSASIRSIHSRRSSIIYADLHCKPAVVGGIYEKGTVKIPPLVSQPSLKNDNFQSLKLDNKNISQLSIDTNIARIKKEKSLPPKASVYSDMSALPSLCLSVEFERKSIFSADDIYNVVKPHKVIRLYNNRFEEPGTEKAQGRPFFRKRDKIKSSKKPSATTALKKPGNIYEEAPSSSSISTSSVDSKTALNTDFNKTPILSTELQLGSPAVDYIDAFNEESFTLEPFENLIQACHIAKKHFILARVTTADPNDPKKLYYSYYDGQHINKVLFRLQPQENLLHRMRAKNPLNNMPIIGKVQYFVVTPEQVDLAIKKYHRNRIRKFLMENLNEEEKSHKNLRANLIGPLEMDQGNALSIVSKGGNDLAPQQLDTLPDPRTVSMAMGAALKGSYPSSVISYCKSEIDTLKKRGILNDEDLESILENSEKDSVNISINSKNSKQNIVSEYGDNIIIYNAYLYGTDEDYLLKEPVRAFFKNNSVNSRDHELFNLYPNDVRNGTLPPFLSQSGPTNSRLLSQRNLWNCFGIYAPRSKSFRRITFAVIVIFYTFTSTLIVLLVVPDSLKLIVTISLVVLLALMGVIFIDSERHMNYEASSEIQV